MAFYLLNATAHRTRKADRTLKSLDGIFNAIEVFLPIFIAETLFDIADPWEKWGHGIHYPEQLLLADPYWAAKSS